MNNFKVLVSDKSCVIMYELCRTKAEGIEIQNKYKHMKELTFEIVEI
jgi:hypothetical protein|tara:strand:+ start:10199 stop:10339 length:141 start_codon:yes stop_codon:yes gene_type:complete